MGDGTQTLHSSRAESLGSGLLSLSKGAVAAQTFGPGFLRPAYEHYCFSRLPGFLERTLTGHTHKVSLPEEVQRVVGDDIRQVIFLFFDAFGWCSYERFLDRSPLLQSFQADGEVVKLTSQFPSTTAAHVTTINSGLPVYQHGVCEWHYYEPLLGTLMNPFKLCLPHEHSKDTLLARGYKTSDLFPPNAFIKELAAQGVNAVHYGPGGYFPSTYTLHFCENDAVRGYRTVTAGVNDVIEQVQNARGKTFHYFYIDAYDSMCHLYAPYSRMADKAALTALETLEPLRTLCELPGTLLMLTADHGQVVIPEETEVFINKVFPELAEYLLEAPNQGPVYSGGGARDLLLYTKPGAADSLASQLASKLHGVAEVYTQAQAADLGILGPLPLSTRFAQRIGDVLVLPHHGHSVVWHDPPAHPRQFMHGHHGGLTAEEMEIPLLLLRS